MDKSVSTDASPVTRIMTTSFTMGWFSLFVLAGGIPIPPFSYLGYGGLNLWAAGSLTWCLTKAAFQACLVFLAAIITASYPQLAWMGHLVVFNPWYVFDIVQLFSPAFATEGFKLPLTHFDINNPLIPPRPVKPGVQKGGGIEYGYGDAKVTMPLALSSVALLCTGVYSLLDMIPKSLAKIYTPIVNTVFASAAGLVTIVGGLGSTTILPQLMNYFTSNQTGSGIVEDVEDEYPRKKYRTTKAAQAAPPLFASGASGASGSIATFAGASITPQIYMPTLNDIKQEVNAAVAASGASAPSPEPVSSTNNYLPQNVFTPIPVSSGALPVSGPIQQGGADMPSLGEVAEMLIKKRNMNMNNVQLGGGNDDSSVYIFLGSLAFITASGLGLALIRSKRLSIEAI